MLDARFKKHGHYFLTLDMFRNVLKTRVKTYPSCMCFTQELGGSERSKKNVCERSSTRRGRPRSWDGQGGQQVKRIYELSKI